jgi:hypothetical protein
MTAGTPAGAGQVRNPFKSFLSPGADQIDITFYATNISLTAGQSLPSQINIDAGTDFYWFASSYQADLGGVAFDPVSNQPLVPLITVIITDTGSQRNLMNQAVPVTTIAGDGKLPYRLLLPRLFKANSIVQFNWSSYEDTNADSLRFVMHGFRLPPNADFSQYFR